MLFYMFVADISCICGVHIALDFSLRCYTNIPITNTYTLVHKYTCKYVRKHSVKTNCCCNVALCAHRVHCWESNLDQVRMYI